MRRRLWIPGLALLLVGSALMGSSVPPKAPAPPTKPSAKSTPAKPTPNRPKTPKAVPAKGRSAKPQQPKRLPKLLDLGADRCIPCKMMIPVLDDMKKSYKGKLTVQFIDVWKDPAAKEKYKIQIIPTQILYDAKGKEVYRHQGYISKEDLIAAFRKHGVKL